MKLPELILAAFLFCITVVCIYVIFFILFRRPQRARAKALAEKEAEEKTKKKTGTPDFLHCELNEIMGYDFIQIKDIDRTPPAPKNEFEDTVGKPAGVHGPVDGLDNEMGTTGVTEQETGPETEDENTIQLGRRNNKPQEQPAAATKKEEKPTGQEISMDQLRMLDEDFEWSESDHSLTERDQYMDSLMDDIEKYGEDGAIGNGDDEEDDNAPTGESGYTEEEKEAREEALGEAFSAIDMLASLDQHQDEEDELARQIMESDGNDAESSEGGEEIDMENIEIVPEE